MYGHTLPVRTRPGLGSISVIDDETSEKFVAIGIDFGTTYSGVSWARSTRPKELNEITGCSSEDPRNRRETQVPTLYDMDTGKWGYEITPDMVPMRWFKLLLLNDDDIQKEDVRNSPQLRQARQLLSRSVSRKKPVEIVGAYLGKIWDHTYATLKTMMDIEDLPLRVAITIPAIWPAYAQSLMREAAKIAGITKKRDIGATTLILVQEPEAAALASLFQHSSFPEIQRNESFIVCDAGGGTVDVISYTVTSERPFKLEECVPGDGKLAGAFQIDQAFEAHLRGKSKLKITSLSASDYNQFIQKEWELGAKRTFNNASEPRFFNLHPPSKAYGTMDRLRHRETLAINKEEMKGFFSRSLTGIRSLVNSQYKQIEKATGKPPKKILLVGGLGSSEYVYDVLNDFFDNRVLRPSDSWSAVARGAILRLLQENISSQTALSSKQRVALAVLPNVVSRRSRNHYGIVVDTSVETEELEPEDEPYTDPEGVRRVTRMEWYLKKGDKVEKASRIPITYHGFYQAPLPPKCTFVIMYSSEDVVPKRPGPSVTELCRIECDWDKPIEEWKAVGNPYTGWRKHEDLELTMGLEGEPRWEIRIGSKRAEHNFEVQYMG
ncbi:Chaperone protein HscA -like protein [Colletotrichum tanaceti]|uniref:Chaperone protein HscA-like protein n=1 Tax=Colletotrichum tanaceti TaxID=1306861 RepID=A0A4U6X674_9PEZI|nr:Chaperone protein HscA -like protein [Colletotrichum tanaceti]TKW50574.1 Chaperone protein HscA -like protein [Colletotrichum tanaceti]